MKRIGIPFLLVLIFTLSIFSCRTLNDSVTKTVYGQKDIDLLKDGGSAYLLLIEALINTNPNKPNLCLGIQTFSAYKTAFIKDPKRKQIFNEKTVML